MNDLSQTSVNASGLDSTYTDFTAGWMGPVEALTRFAPSERIAIEGGSVGENIDTRYGIRISGFGMLIGARAQCEFILPVPVSRVPNTPPWFAGLMNLRGALVPVFDLAPLFGANDDDTILQGNSGDATRSLILVLDRGERAGALQIRGFPRALTGLTQLDEMPPTPEPLDQCVTNAYIEDGSVWLEFDHLRLFEALSLRLAG